MGSMRIALQLIFICLYVYSSGVISSWRTCRAAGRMQDLGRSDAAWTDAQFPWPAGAFPQYREAKKNPTAAVAPPQPATGKAMTPALPAPLPAICLRPVSCFTSRLSGRSPPQPAY